MVRVAVCELNGEQGDVPSEWDRLVSHCRQFGPELVLLPEMAFAPWLPAQREFDPDAWREAAVSHERWLQRFDELGAEVVVGSRPVVEEDGSRFNEGFVWESGRGLQAAHRKTYLPDEPGFWEASWYSRGPTTFDPVVTAVGTVGFLICTELWFLERARHYGERDVDILVCPRATPTVSLDRWLAAGRVAGVCAGSFCLSSNRAGSTGDTAFAGAGWITDPDGGLMARTSALAPALTVEVDLSSAQEAKSSYPRYIDSTTIPEVHGP